MLMGYLDDPTLVTFSVEYPVPMEGLLLSLDKVCAAFRAQRREHNAQMLARFFETPAPGWTKSIDRIHIRLTPYAERGKIRIFEDVPLENIIIPRSFEETMRDPNRMRTAVLVGHPDDLRDEFGHTQAEEPK